MREYYAENGQSVKSFDCSYEQPSETVETARTLKELGKAGDRLLKWDITKANADQVSVAYATEPAFKRIAERVDACANELYVKRFEVGGKWKAYAMRCKVRHCPVCQRAEAAMKAKAVSKALIDVQYENPKMRWILLTLTVKNCQLEDLRDNITHITASWKRLIELKELAAVKGFVRGIEVTRSNDGTAHPHMHAVLAVPESYFKKNYISQVRWTELWAQSARLDYAPLVDVRSIKKEKQAGAVLEVTKASGYSIKSSEFEADPAWLIAFHVQVKGLRFFSTGGIIAKAMKDPAPTEELDADEEPETEGKEPVQSIAFGWARPTKRYER
jgi:plasmid rolling circle replication initiator protein Rep